MKNFLKTLALFLLVGIILAFCLDYAITKGLRKRTDYHQEVWNDVLNPEVNPDVLVLGSCAAHYDCNPKIMDSVLHCDSYVLSMSNLTFPCHNFMWTMYEKCHKQLPKVVVFLLDYGDMDFREVKGSQEETQFLSLTYHKEARDFLTQYGGYNFFEIYAPCYRYFGYHERIKYGLYNFIGVKRYKGHAQHYKGFIPLDKPYVFNSEWYGKENVVPVQPEIAQMFENLLTDCKESGVQVVLAVAPLGHELEDIIVNRDEIYGFYESLADNYGFHYVSFSENEFSHDIHNFESPNHLNAQAADVFTIQLADYIKSIEIY